MPKSFKKIKLQLLFPEVIREGMRSCLKDLVLELQTSIPSRPESAYRHGVGGDLGKEPHLSDSFRYGTRVSENGISGWLYSTHPRAGEFLDMWITGRRGGFEAGHKSGKATFIEKFGSDTGEENLTVGKYGDLGVYVRAGKPIKAAIVEPIIGQKLDEFTKKFGEYIMDSLSKRGALRVVQ